MVQPLWEAAQHCLLKTKEHIPYDLAPLSSGIDQQKCVQVFSQKTCTRMFVVANSPQMEANQKSSIINLKNISRYIHLMEYCTTMRKNELQKYG